MLPTLDHVEDAPTRETYFDTRTNTIRRREADPTPEEITAACAEIRRGWSHHERLVRAGLIACEADALHYHWTPPTIRTTTMGSGVRP